MKEKDNITFLALNVFDSTGGVQKVSRTLCHTLATLFGDRLRAFSLNDSEPDIRYISSGLFSGFSGMKMLFAGKALIRGARSTHIILSHVNLVAVAILIKLINPRAKLILIAHGTEVWRRLPLWKSSFMSRHMHIWAVSNYTNERLNEQYNLSKPSCVVNNCLDPFFRIPANFSKPEYLMSRYSLSGQQPILLTICRLNEHEHLKGYGQVISLLKKLRDDFPGIRYLLCGQADENELDRLNFLISKNGLDAHITLCGFIEEQELTDHYLLADVFVMPSRKEGFGLVLTEAAVCGCKIIAGNQDGSRDALLDGRLGVLTDPFEADKLCRTIIGSLRNRHDRKGKHKLQAMALEHFGHELYREKIKNAISAC